MRSFPPRPIHSLDTYPRVPLLQDLIAVRDEVEGATVGEKWQRRSAKSRYGIDLAEVSQ